MQACEWSLTVKARKFSMRSSFFWVEPCRSLLLLRPLYYSVDLDWRHVHGPSRTDHGHFFRHGACLHLIRQRTLQALHETYPMPRIWIPTYPGEPSPCYVHMRAQTCKSSSWWSWTSSDWYWEGAVNHVFQVHTSH